MTIQELHEELQQLIAEGHSSKKVVVVNAHTSIVESISHVGDPRQYSFTDSYLTVYDYSIQYGDEYVPIFI